MAWRMNPADVRGNLLVIRGLLLTASARLPVVVFATSLPDRRSCRDLPVAANGRTGDRSRTSAVHQSLTFRLRGAWAVPTYTLSKLGTCAISQQRS